MKKILVIFIALFTLVLASCSSTQSTSQAKEKIIISTSIEPVSTFVKKVVGDKIEVNTIIPSNASPETYSPNMEDQKKLEDTTLYFSIGVPAEASNILKNISKNATVVSLADAVDSKVDPLKFSNGARDPHIWMSISRVKIMVDVILEKVISLDNDNSEYYTNNAANYKDKLDEASQTIHNMLFNIAKHDIIIYHPSLNYLCNQYAITLNALEEDGQDATINTRKQIIDLAKSQDIKTVFFQTGESSSIVDDVANEIGGTTYEFNPLSGDYINNIISISTKISEVLS